MSDSAGLGLYRHHMLVTSLVTVGYDRGKKYYRVSIIHLNENGIVEDKVTLKPGKFRMHNYPSEFTGSAAVHNARIIKKERPGRGKKVYNLLSYNCESFVREAKTGVPCSRQVVTSIKSAAGTAAGSAALIPSGAVIGGVIGSFVPVPVVGTVVGAIACGAVTGVVGVALGNVNTAVDYAAERILEN